MATPWGVGTKALGAADKGLKAMRMAQAFSGGGKSAPMSAPRQGPSMPTQNYSDIMGQGLLGLSDEEKLKLLLKMKGMQ
jgi:hypothetical protein